MKSDQDFLSHLESYRDLFIQRFHSWGSSELPVSKDRRSKTAASREEEIGIQGFVEWLKQIPESYLVRDLAELRFEVQFVRDQLAPIQPDRDSLPSIERGRKSIAILMERIRAIEEELSIRHRVKTGK